MGNDSLIITDLKTKVLFGLLVLAILFSAGATYYKYLVLEDFAVVEPSEEAIAEESVSV
jgi:hypothetical protein